VPANASSAALTDNYRRILFAIRQRATAATAAQWGAIDGANLDASFRTWLVAATAITSTLQAQAVVLTEGYFNAYISSELGRRPATSPTVRPTEYAGTARDGRPLGQALAPALYTVKMAVAQARPIDQALQMGLHRATRNIAGEVVSPARLALTALMTESDHVEGWKRVTSGAACGCCLGASTGAIHPVDDIMKVHEHCRCSAEAVVRDVIETVRRPSGTDIFNGLSSTAQDALFAGRGGAAKADLVRNGDIELHDLVSPSPMATRADDITETPLEALVPQPHAAMA
jgi:hypothetical protein